MSGRLTGKTALVLGAGSVGEGWGNGKATAVLFAREGAKVLCADINEAAATATAAIIRDEGGAADVIRTDVTKEVDIIAAKDRCLDLWGRIDILDNNVGIAEAKDITELSEAEWDRVLDINLKSCFLGMKHVIPVMVDQGGGSIVNISSIAGVRYIGVPYPTYYATKGAMNQLTRATAVQYAPQGVRINAILPGLMKTPMVEKAASLAATYADGDVEGMWKVRDAQCPMGHMGDAWDVAHAALFLASDEAKYITGIELLVDGGITAKMS